MRGKQFSPSSLAPALATAPGAPSDAVSHGAIFHYIGLKCDMFGIVYTHTLGRSGGAEGASRQSRHVFVYELLAALFWGAWHVSLEWVLISAP